MSEDRTFRSLYDADREIIWRFCKQSPTGRWSGIEKAREAIAQRRGPRGKKPSRPLVNAFLVDFPTKPTKRVRKGFKPKYVEKFEQTAGYKQIVEYHQRRNLSRDVTGGRLKIAREGWMYLNKTDPVGWTIEDFQRLTDNPEWKDYIRAEQFGKTPEQALIGFNQMTDLRNVMVALGHRDWIDEFPTKGLKRRKGLRRQWFLRKNEVRAIAEAMEDPTAKMLFIMACYTGSRISTYYNATFGELSLDIVGRETWEAFETKTGKPVEKQLNPKLVAHLKQHIAAMRAAGKAGHNDRLFPRTSVFYTDQLRKAAKKAGLCESGIDPSTGKHVDDLVHGHRIGWHVTRHTFASQLAHEGVPLEHIMRQGPWKSAEVLLTYYTGIDTAKIRVSMNKLDLG